MSSMDGTVGSSSASSQSQPSTTASVELEEMLEKVWAVADRDGSGDVSTTEMKSMVEKLTGRPVSALQLQSLVEKIDRDGDGTITKKEFFAAVQDFVLAGTAASPRRSAKRGAASGAGADEPTGAVISRRRVLDDIRAMFDLSDASLDEEARMRLAMVAATDGDEVAALSSFERQVKAEEEAKSRAKSLEKLEHLASEAGAKTRGEVAAAIATGSPDRKLKGLEFVAGALSAASDWSKHTKDRRVQKLVLAVYEWVHSSKIPQGAARVLAFSSGDSTRLRNEVLVQAVVSSLQVLRMFAQGPGFLHLAPSNMWHVSNACTYTRTPMLRAAVTRAGETVGHLALRLGTTCGIHAVRYHCFKLLTALASFAGDSVQDFRIPLTKVHKLAQVCCQRLNDLDHPEPPENREAISECLATMCGHGHGSPPHALDRVAYDRMGGLLLTTTILKRLQLDKLNLSKPEYLVATYGHHTNLCNAFVHVLPCSRVDPAAWGFILERAKPRHLHSEHVQSRLAAAKFIRSVLQMIALILMHRSDHLLKLVLRPSRYLPNGLVQDAIVPVLQDADVSTEVKLKALQCLTSLSTRPTTEDGVDPRGAIGENARLLGLLVDFVQKDPELRVRAIVVLEHLAKHRGSCERLMAGGVVETMSRALEHYRMQDEDVKDAIGIASYVYNTTLAKHALACMDFFVRAATKARLDQGGKPSTHIKHFVRTELVDRVNVVLQIIVDESRRRRRMFEEGKEVEVAVGQFLVALRDEMQACAEARVEGAKELATRAQSAIERYRATRSKLQEAMQKEAAMKITGSLEEELRAYSGSASTGIVAECVVRAAEDHSNSRFFKLDSKSSFSKVRAYIEHLYEYHVMEGAGVFDSGAAQGGGGRSGASDSSATHGSAHLDLAYSLKGSKSPDKPIRNDAELRQAIEYYRKEMLPELSIYARRADGRSLKSLPDLRGRNAADEIASMMRNNYGDRGLPEVDQVRRVVQYFQRQGVKELDPKGFMNFLRYFRMKEAESVEKAKVLFRAIDRDNSGTLSVPEILMWAAVKQKGSRKEKIRMAFRAYDADGSGTIGDDELIQILRSQGGHSRDSAGRAAD